MALIAAATSTGGATALVAKKLRAKSDAKRIPTEPKSGEFIMTKRTLTMTKSSINRVALIEGDEGIGSETAAILASASPLGITTMGAFPLSLIALGQITRRHFDDTLTLRPKRTTNATEALESPQQIEMTALTEQIETAKPGARPYPSPTFAQGRGWLAALATLIALVALFLIAMLPR